MDKNHYLWVYQQIGRQILINTCSSALLILCKSPLYRKVKRVKESIEDLEFINSGGLKGISEYFMLEINGDYLEELLLEKAKKIRGKYVNKTNDTCSYTSI